MLQALQKNKQIQYKTATVTPNMAENALRTRRTGSFSLRSPDDSGLLSLSKKSSVSWMFLTG